MPISLARAHAHIEEWTEKLPSRPWWPNHLFFAAHVTAAADILNSGRLQSRSALLQAVGIPHDIANQDALGTNPAAFEFVRLYFRPRTFFHLRTEGIKLLSDANRLPAHMSVPIMFVFRFEDVVTRQRVAFCDRKMAHVGILPGDDEAYFDNIDFSKVYHDRGISDPQERNAINDRRMAEVLVPQELPLDGTLERVICRTQFDRITLRSLLRDQAGWREKIRTSTKPAEMFFCWGAYLTELSLSGDVLTLRVKASNDYRAGDKIKLRVVQRLPDRKMCVYDEKMQITNNGIQIRGWAPEHPDRWRIDIEDALAFAGPIPVSAPGRVVASA